MSKIKENKIYKLIDEKREHGKKGKGTDTLAIVT